MVLLRVGIAERKRQQRKDQSAVYSADTMRRGTHQKQVIPIGSPLGGTCVQTYVRKYVCTYVLYAAVVWHWRIESLALTQIHTCTFVCTYACTHKDMHTMYERTCAHMHICTYNMECHALLTCLASRTNLEGRKRVPSCGWMDRPWGETSVRLLNCKWGLCGGGGGAGVCAGRAGN